MNKKTLNIIGWILAVVTGGFLVMAGSSKVMADPMHLENFARWGFPVWFMYLIGVLEVLGGVGLFIPKLRSLASLGLVGIMLGAIGTHVAFGEFAYLMMPSILLATSAAIFLIRKKEFPISKSGKVEIAYS